MIICDEKSLANHRKKNGTITTKLISTMNKLMEGIREMRDRTKPVRIRREKSPDSVWASGKGPPLLNARAADRLNIVKYPTAQRMPRREFRIKEIDENAGWNTLTPFRHRNQNG